MSKSSTNYKSDIGQRLLQLRTAQNLTQAKLADIMDITSKHLGCVERGQASLSIDKLVEFSRYFDVTLDYLILGRTNENSDERQMPLDFVELFKDADENEYRLMYEYMRMYLTLRRELNK